MACVEAPTVTPNKMVTISIIEVLAVSANLLVTPLSFSKLPKNNIPKRGIALGEINAVNRNPIIGNRIFSKRGTTRGGFIRITRSLLLVSNRIMGG